MLCYNNQQEHIKHPVKCKQCHSSLNINKQHSTLGLSSVVLIFNKLLDYQTIIKLLFTIRSQFEFLNSFDIKTHQFTTFYGTLFFHVALPPGTLFPSSPPKGHECEVRLTHKSSRMTGLEIRPDLVCDRFSVPACMLTLESPCF